MRPLTLHVSALSDTEYDLYTASLNDLATESTDSTTNVPTTTSVRGDAHYERTSVGAREVRAWLRGRYSDLPASDIDAVSSGVTPTDPTTNTSLLPFPQPLIQILKLFCPNMLPSDTLTGGQFFAALRLVLHAGSGKGVDRMLAFVQGV